MTNKACSLKTLATVKSEALGQLSTVDDAIVLDVDLIIAKVCQLSRSACYAFPERLVSEVEYQQIHSWIARRATGEPLAYIFQEKEFWSLLLEVNSSTLIPRPETERLVDIAISLLMKSTGNADKLVADLGTGSGAVGLSIADECSDAEVILVDNSEDALQVAAANLAGLGNNARKVRILRSSWFEAFPEELQQSFSLIVSNPPYIANGEDLPVEVLHWEPHVALYAGVKGTEHIETILTEARRWLKQNGNVAIEMAPHQIDLMSAKAEKIGYSNIEVHNDLSQRPRVMSCTWK